ncbi:MAG: transporter substrate-binding domain-containing protein [Gammaproteobacteria bacterium]|nr:transporter substrate-binding domain-containing protein [Gammaproteobacteria bacterium]
MKYYSAAALATTLLMPTAFAEDNKQVHITAPDYWCPYACPADQALKGFAIDIAIAAYAAVDIKVVYTNEPYDRALNDVKTGRLDGVAPTFKEEAPDFIFPTHSISTTQYCFYTAQSDWQFSDMNSLNDVRFAATSGYAYSPKMDEYINENKGTQVHLLKGDDVPNRMYQMLKNNRIDAILDDTRLIDYMLNTNEINGTLQQAGCLDSKSYGYLALSPRFLRRSLFLAEQFDIGFTKIKTQGKVAEILKQYGISTE